MAHHHAHHHHGPAQHAVAERPTVSLLRLSAGQRLAGAAVILAALWLVLFTTIG